MILLSNYTEMCWLTTHNYDIPGLEIRGWREPRAPLNSPAASSNVFRKPKDVLVSISNLSR